MQSHDRPNISETVAETLRDMIVDGRLEDGTRINEVHLSEQLAISRTPLREALMRLASEGALTVKPRIGFFVQPLTVEELEQIYPMRAILDPQALRIAGLPSRDALARLTAINNQLRALTSPRQVLAADDRFHRELLAECPNRVLV